MEWISVEDRFPENDNKFGFFPCLVSVGKFPVVREAIFNTKTNRFLTRQFDDLSEAKITHWMPLPEPPKENQK